MFLAKGASSTITDGDYGSACDPMLTGQGAGDYQVLTDMIIKCSRGERVQKPGSEIDAVREIQ